MGNANTFSLNNEYWVHIPIVYNIIFPIVRLFLPDNDIFFRSSFIIVLFGFLLVFLSSKYSRMELPKDQDQVHDLRSDNPVIILGAIYGVVAGFSITEALRTYHEAAAKTLSGLPLDIAFHLIGFFSIAVLFYHGGAVFLTTAVTEITDKAQQQNEKNRKKSYEIIVFYNFIFLFAEGIFLYFMAINLDNIVRFVMSIVVLMVSDIVWSTIGVIRQAHNKDIPRITPVQWIHINLLMISFLSIFLLFRPTHENTLVADIFLLVVLLSRTIVDYLVAWELVYFRRFGRGGSELNKKHSSH